MEQENTPIADIAAKIEAALTEIEAALQLIIDRFNQHKKPE